MVSARVPSHFKRSLKVLFLLIFILFLALRGGNYFRLFRAGSRSDLPLQFTECRSDLLCQANTHSWGITTLMGSSTVRDSMSPHLHKGKANYNKVHFPETPKLTSIFSIQSDFRRRSRYCVFAKTRVSS